MLKFLDKPITWKSYILLTVAVNLVGFLAGVAHQAYEEARGYDIDLDYKENKEY